MRQLLNRAMAPTADRGCDYCGILGVKGPWNATKFLGYVKPADSSYPDDTPGFWQECQAYATGVIPNRHKRTLDQQVVAWSTHLTTDQCCTRDRKVEKRREDLCRRRDDVLPAVMPDYAGTSAAIDRECKKFGSWGHSEFVRAKVPYWDSRLHAPFATYHVMYLGIAKDWLRWLNVRYAATSKKEDTVLAFERPKDARTVLHNRLRQIVLRDKPDCLMVDFTQYVGSMSMSEIQLLYEVGVPYICHDLRDFGVPAAVVVMWLLLRHGMMVFTRLQPCHSKAEYEAYLNSGRSALLAYAALAEYFHANTDNRAGISQFSFTWKLHIAVAHFVDQCLGSGHPIQSNDMWVERMMRHKACTVVKYAGPFHFHRRVLHTDLNSTECTMQGQGRWQHRKCDPVSPHGKPQCKGHGDAPAARPRHPRPR